MRIFWSYSHVASLLLARVIAISPFPHPVTRSKPTQLVSNQNNLIKLLLYGFQSAPKFSIDNFLTKLSIFKSVSPLGVTPRTPKNTLLFYSLIPGTRPNPTLSQVQLSEACLIATGLLWDDCTSEQSPSTFGRWPCSAAEGCA